MFASMPHSLGSSHRVGSRRALLTACWPADHRARPSEASGGQVGGEEPRVWEPSQGSHYIRVGVAGLCPAEPERGRVWEPSQGSHCTRVGEAGLCPAEPERGRVWEPSQGSHHKTTQPPWSASTRAAGLPRPCWLRSAIYVKRLSLTVARAGTPACAGAWEDKQQEELKPCCLLPLTAIPMPNPFGLASVQLSYWNFGDFLRIPEPQPRHVTPLPTTSASGIQGFRRRNLQG
jgi:hypothetical protein